MYYLSRLLIDWTNKLRTQKNIPAKPSTSPAIELQSPSPPTARWVSNPQANPLEGKPLRYLIGSSGVPTGKQGEVVEVGYDVVRPCPLGISIAYANLFNEKYSEQSASARDLYGPYLKDSDTAKDYGEGQIDPRGLGWKRNLVEQFERRKKQGFEYIELDNPDAYSLADVLGAVDLATSYGLKVIAKNPLLIQGDPSPYVAKCHAVIIERCAGSPADMEALRRKAGKPSLPVWFVGFRKPGEDGWQWARDTALLAASFKNMFCTFSPSGEYTSAEDVPGPITWSPAAGQPAPAPTANPATPDPTVDYAAEYLADWKAMQIRPERAVEVEAIARKLLGHKTRYQTVEAKSGAPWYVIAVLHERESGADFSTYLGNGDPLDEETTHVPRGRGPFSSWEAGAIDALAYDGLDKIRSWPIERIAYECEHYNGFGYRSHGVPSAYLWSFSNIYKGGKYVADGVWSSSAQDAQCGTMPMLKAMAALDASIPLQNAAAVTSPEPPKPVPHPDSGDLHDLGHRIKRTMLALNYPWFPDQNVVSVEGMDPDGTPNKNRPNAFDDIKMVVDGSGKIIGGPWEATTQPGVYWTEHPMAEGGAFIIAKGPQCCWEPGDYHGPAWRQKEDSTIMGHRDPNCTYKRQGPPVKHANIGVHHHKGYDLPRDNISNAAAGCQVIRLNEDQLAFVTLTKKSANFMTNGLTATVLEPKDILL